MVFCLQFIIANKDKIAMILIYDREEAEIPNNGPNTKKQCFFL
jgi:hypothetical protein